MWCCDWTATTPRRSRSWPRRSTARRGPCFWGANPAWPTRRLFAGWIEADSPHAALKALAAQGLTGRALWPDDGRPYAGALKYDLQDLRNWKTGLHGGTRIVCEGEIA